MNLYKRLLIRATFLALATGLTPLALAEIIGPREGTMSLPDFTVLARQEGSAIVNISTQQARNNVTPRALSGRELPESLQEFLRRFGAVDRNTERYTRTMGSGFIIDGAGHILTSAHLVDGADEITVGLIDKRQFSAKVIGADKSTDIALLKIEPANLPFVRIGDPAKLEVGEWVVAIGAPFGFTNTVTQGIVSAKGRDLPGDGTTPFIQTDAAINPGNSGGPLFNMRGEVVGINAQIFSRSGGYMGISFAIPIDVAFRIKDELLKYGSIRRARLGLMTQDVSRELARSFGLPEARGALITALEKGGPGERGGLKTGDIVLEFNGMAISSPTDLARTVAESTPEARIRLKFWRDGMARETRIRLGEVAIASKPAPPTRITVDRLGLMLLELDQADRRMMGTEGIVMIEAVDGVAARAGIQPGDMVLAINSKEISSLAELSQELAKGQKHIALLIEREANTNLFVPLTLE